MTTVLNVLSMLRAVVLLFSGCVTTFAEFYHSVAGSLRWWIRGKVSVMVAGKSTEGTGIGNDWVVWYIYLLYSTCRICHLYEQACIY
ncbi:hypothetical protein V1519DRAFT_457228, partial [Lipomyces tetrasporus]